VENNEHLSQDRWSSVRLLNRGPPEYEARVLTTQPRRSVSDFIDLATVVNLIVVTVRP
jgi:hypothetical protein